MLPLLSLDGGITRYRDDPPMRKASQSMIYLHSSVREHGPKDWAALLKDHVT